jgi:hypothetical protein
VRTSSSASTGGVPTTRWLKGIIGLSNMLTVLGFSHQAA